MLFKGHPNRNQSMVLLFHYLVEIAPSNFLSESLWKRAAKLHYWWCNAKFQCFMYSIQIWIAGSYPVPRVILQKACSCMALVQLCIWGLPQSQMWASNLWVNNQLPNMALALRAAWIEQQWYFSYVVVNYLSVYLDEPIEVVLALI